MALPSGKKRSNGPRRNDVIDYSNSYTTSIRDVTTTHSSSAWHTRRRRSSNCSQMESQPQDDSNKTELSKSECEDSIEHETPRSDDDDNSVMRMRSLEERVRNLESLLSIVMNNTMEDGGSSGPSGCSDGITNDPSSPPPPDNIFNGRERGVEKPRLSRRPSSQFAFPPVVEYRCFSSSYEEGLRRMIQNDAQMINATKKTELSKSDCADSVVVMNANASPTTPCKFSDEKKEDDNTNNNNVNGKKPSLSPSSSPPAVEYRCFSTSFEEGLRQRVRSESNANEQHASAVGGSTSNTSTTPKDEQSQHLSTKNTPLISPTPCNGQHQTTNNICNKNGTPRSTNILEYIKVEMLGEGQLLPKGTTAAAEETDAIMEEFLRVPSRVETLLLFGLAVCVDSYLYVLTYLPLKFIWGSLRLVCTIVAPFQRTFRFHRRHLYQILQVLIIASVYHFVLSPVSIGRTYHWIRGQNILKLYLLIAIVEVFDRLMCSFGQDALDSLYWNTTSRPWHKRTYISFLVVLTYAAVHSLLLFIHIATLNVAMNSADNALLSLLIGGNFAEIKSTVFKKYNKQNLFKITTADICERFKLALFLMLILLLNIAQGGVTVSVGKEYLSMCALVLMAEILADAIKHSFITKFNFIKSTVYADYQIIIAGDVTGLGHEGVNLDHTHAVVKRIGFSQLPLVCVMMMYLREAVRYGSMQVGREGIWDQRVWLGLWAVLLFLKVAMGIGLKRISNWVLGSVAEQSGMPEGASAKKGGDVKHKSMVQKRQVV